MSKRTPEQELEFQMRKMKDMGITISTQRTFGQGDESRVVDIIADAAKEAGIYYERESK